MYGHIYLIPVPTKMEKMFTRFLARFFIRVFGEKIQFTVLLGQRNNWNMFSANRISVL